MNSRHARFLRLGMLLGLCAPLGCGDGEGSGGVSVASRRADGSKLSGDDKDAAAFVRSKLEECWEKGADGWTTALVLRNLLGQEMAGIPDVQFHQYREFKLSIVPEELTEAQRLNGADYRARAELERTPERSYRNVATYEGPEGWSSWKDGNPAFGGLAVERRKGQWLIQDDELFAGRKPAGGAVPPSP